MRNRSLPVLQPSLKSMPHYAIWDDHDYGPNDANKTYILKNESRYIFIDTCGNPSFGDGKEGIYSKFTYNHVDVFLMDDRLYRSNDYTPDSIDGKINSDKPMFGAIQMEW